MSYKKLEERLENDAKEKIKKIHQQTDEEIQRLNEQIKSDAEAQAVQIREQGARTAELNRMQAIGRAKRRLSQKLSDEKAKQIKEAIERAIDEVSNLDETRLKKYLTALTKDAVLLGDDPQVVVDPRYRKLLDGLDLDITEKPIGFGLMMHSKDGEKTIDARFVSIVQSKKARVYPEVEKILFT